MATRQHVQVQREALKKSLRVACQENRLRPGDAAPPLRQLGEEFALSQGVIVAALRELIDEGLFHTIERLGTFVGPPRPKERPLFVLINGVHLARYVQLRGGFEERISALGGSVTTIYKEQARQLLRDGHFPDCAGVFEFELFLDDTLHELLTEQSLNVSPPSIGAVVRFGKESHDESDRVSFDDNAGGRLATEHLLALEHKRIAFLGLHQNPQAVEDCVPEWSCWRQHGWQKAIEEAGSPGAHLPFYADSRWDYDANNALLESECTEHFMDTFVKSLDTAEKITAAVVVNDELAARLFDRLREAGIERSLWPAIISFDGQEDVQNDVVTSLRLPWEKLGCSAAEILWKRSRGILVGPPVHRAVPMRLIPRLSCRADWSSLAMVSL